VLQQLDGRLEYRLGLGPIASQLGEFSALLRFYSTPSIWPPAVAMALSFNISLDDDNAYFTAGPAARNSIVNEVTSVIVPILHDRLKVTNASEDAWDTETQALHYTRSTPKLCLLIIP